MRLLIVLLVATLVTPSASAMTESRRRFLCRTAVLGAAAVFGISYRKEIVDAFERIPDAPIRPEQLTDEGFSSDPLVNLRQKVANMHGVRITAVAAGPGAVTQRQFGRFLREFLDAAGMMGQNPPLFSFLPPRTITVDSGNGAPRYRRESVWVPWNQAQELVREEYRRIHEATFLESHLEIATGVHLQRGAWIDGMRLTPMVPFEEYVAFLQHFVEYSKDMTPAQFAAANFTRDPVFVGSEAEALALGRELPQRSLVLPELQDVLRKVREGKFTFPRAVGLAPPI